MSRRKALFMLTLLLVIAFCWLKSREAADSGAPENSLWPFDIPNVVRVGIQHAEDVATLVAVEPSDSPVFEAFYPPSTYGNWILSDPKGAPVRPDFIGELIESFANAEPKRLLKANEQLSSLEEYGLNPPRLQLAFDTGSKSETLLFGKHLPVGSGRYAKLESSEEVFILDEALFVKVFKRKPEIWESAPLFFEAENVKDLTATFLGLPRFALQRQSAGDANWNVIREGVTYPADENIVRESLLRINNLTVTNYVNVFSDTVGYYKITNPNLVLVLRLKDEKSKVLLSFGEVIESTRIAEEKARGQSERTFYFKVRDHPLICEFRGPFISHFLQDGSYFFDRSLASHLNIAATDSIEVALDGDNEKSFASSEAVKKILDILEEERVLSFLSPEELSSDVQDSRHWLRLRGVDAASKDLFAIEILSEVVSTDVESKKSMTSSTAPRYGRVLRADGQELYFVLSDEYFRKLLQIAENASI